MLDKNTETNDKFRKVTFLMCTIIVLGFKPGKQNWALGSHPGGNSDVTH